MSTVIKVTTNIANVKFLRSTNEVPKDLNYGCFCLVLYFVIFFFVPFCIFGCHTTIVVWALLPFLEAIHLLLVRKSPGCCDFEAF